MSAELKTVKLSSLRPNPFRPPDAPINEARVAAIEAEIRAHGLDTLKARAADNALPYGHHRVEAARRALGADAKVEVLFGDYTDAQMVLELARENDEEWSHDFLTATLTSVRAYLIAYDAGAVDLTPKEGERARTDSRRYTAATAKPYTADSLAAARGGIWLRADGRAADKVVAAVALIAEDLIPDRDLAGLGPAQVRAALEVARATKRSREAAAEAERQVLEQAAKVAERAKDEDGQPAPDTRKAETLRARIAEVTVREETEAPKLARETVKQAVKMLKAGESVRAVKETLAPVIVQRTAAPVKKTARGLLKDAREVGPISDRKEKDVRRLETAILARNKVLHDVNEEVLRAHKALQGDKDLRKVIDAVKKRDVAPQRAKALRDALNRLSKLTAYMANELEG